MSSITPVQEILDLLQELENLTLKDPRLVEEWNAAQKDFPGELLTEDRQARFSEWFLIERISETLGVQPIVAFAPKSLGAEDPWTCLMDSLLGIFQLTGGQRMDDGSEAFELSDLWSGRTILIRTNEAPELQNLDDDCLCFGRFIQVEDPFHAPLPSVTISALPGLTQALGDDLAEARKKQSRAKLSQLELEKISLSIPVQNDPDQPDLVALENELAALLEGEPKWGLEQLQSFLAKAGLSETLDALAFETQLDIENLRRVLPEYYQAVAQEDAAEEASPAYSNSHADVPPDSAQACTANQAVEIYEQRRAKGTPLEQSFEELEKALGLPEGISQEDDTEHLADEPVGPLNSGGIQGWINVFTWEMGDSVPTPKILGQFIDFLGSQDLSHIDAQDLNPDCIVPFLMAAGSTAAVLERHAQLRGFLDWAELEQGAQLGALSKAESESFMDRLAGLLELNQSLASGQPWKQRARLLSLNPLTVATDTKDVSASAVGIPEEQQKLLRVGDLLLGSWVNGSFEVAGVLPLEAVPQAEPEDN